MFNILILILIIVSLISFYIEKKHFLLYTIILFNTNFFNFFNETKYLFDSIILSDISIVLFLFLIINSKFKNYSYSKYIYFFFIGLFVLISYDFYWRNNDALSIFKSTRHLIFLLAINLKGFDESIIKRTFNLIILSGFFISILFLFEVLFNINFLPFEFQYDDSSIVNRPLYSPLFLTLFIILLIPAKRSFKKLFFLFVFFLSLFISSSFGSIFSIFIVLLIYFYFKYKFSIQRVFLVGFSSALVFFSADIINNSLSNKGISVKEIFSFNLNNINEDYLNELRFSGSGSFRIAVLIERLYYVISDSERFIFGAGFTPDQDLKNKLFVVGTESPSLYVGYEQYNSKDIFLPNIITRFGIILSIYFLFTIYKFFVFLSKNKFFNYYFFLGFLFMTSLIFRSFNNNTFFDGINYFILFLFLTNDNILVNISNSKFEK